MFGRGKKKTSTKPARKSRAAAQSGPLRYLGTMQTLQYGRDRLTDVRGLEAVAFHVIALVALLTYRSERRRQDKALLESHQTAIHRALLNDLDPDRDKKRKRFILF